MDETFNSPITYELINELSLCKDEDIADVLNKLYAKALSENEQLTKKIERRFDEKYLKLINSSKNILKQLNNPNLNEEKAEKSDSIDLSSYYKEVEEICSEIQAAMLVKNYDDAMDKLQILVELKDKTKHISDHEFIKSFNTSSSNLFSLLVSQYESDFELYLLLHNWPLDPSKKLPSGISNSLIEQKFTPAFQSLVQLSKYQNSLKGKNSFFILKSSKKLFLLPIQILLRPFQIKFNFHFYGSKKTNNEFKPEWYFTQLLLWANERRPFLQKQIQDEITNNNSLYMDVFMEFLEGLVGLACDKIAHDLPLLLKQDNEAAFAHLIDEAVLFQQQLIGGYSYEETGRLSCVDAMTCPVGFDRWISIEKKMALLRMDEFLLSPSAWTYREEDEMKIPHCGDNFVILINTITDRNRLITITERSLQFATLTKDLLDDMRYRLVQIKNEIVSNGQLKPTSIPTQFILIINFVATIADLLISWSLLPFFDRLHYYNQRKHSTNKDDDHSDDDDDDYDDEENDVGNENITLETNGTYFEEILELYEKVKNDMFAAILKCVVGEFIKLSRPYQQNKFICVHSLKDFVSPTLTSSACSMLNYVRQQLANLQLIFSSKIFSLFWQQLAEKLDEYITEKIIMECHYNETGAAQLKFDLSENLFPIFSLYTTKPENYFKNIKESCHVLTLNQGLAALLRDTITRSMEPSVPRQKAVDPLATLNDLGVQRLTLQQVERLISLRVDWPTLNNIHF